MDKSPRKFEYGHVLSLRDLLPSSFRAVLKCCLPQEALPKTFSKIALLQHNSVLCHYGFPQHFALLEGGFHVCLLMVCCSQQMQAPCGFGCFVCFSTKNSSCTLYVGLQSKLGQSINEILTVLLSQNGFFLLYFPKALSLYPFLVHVTFKVNLCIAYFSYETRYSLLT